jgi:large subunit ribosomal protein L10
VDRAQKRELVERLNDQWKATGVVVVAHYKGMTVAQMTDFRKRIKDAGGVVKVTKNRLAKLAVKGTDVESISDLLQGQTCVAYSQDPVSAAKVSVKYARENEKLVILGGAMGTTRLDLNGVRALADLPSLDELRAKLLGLLQAPAAKLLSTMNEPGSLLARTLAARVAKEEAPAAA